MGRRVAIACCAMMSLAACVGGELSWPADPTQRGPYAVGHASVEIPSPVGGKVAVLLWYPAEAVGGDTGAAYAYRYGNAGCVLFGAAALDDGEPHPVIVFAHGAGAIPDQSTFITEHLASHGFVVAAPRIPGAGYKDIDGENFIGRAFDAAAILRASAEAACGSANGSVAGGYGAVGHSFGAAVTLLALGAGVAPDGVREELRFQARRHPILKGRFEEIRVALPEDTAVRDGRIRAALLMAPAFAGVFTFDRAEVAGLPEVLVVGAGDDLLAPFGRELAALERLFSGAKCVRTVKIEKAGHFHFNDNDGMPGRWVETVTAILKATGKTPGERVAPEVTAPTIRGMAAAFFDNALRAAPRYPGALGRIGTAGVFRIDPEDAPRFEPLGPADRAGRQAGRF